MAKDKYWKKFTKLHGLLYASGSTQEDIILHPKSYDLLLAELRMDDRVTEGMQLMKAITYFGPVGIKKDKFGVNFKDFK